MSGKSVRLYSILIKKMARANIHFISRYCNENTNILQNLYKEEIKEIYNDIRKLFKTSKRRWILNRSIKTKFLMEKAIKKKLLIFPQNNHENYNIDKCYTCNKYGMTMYYRGLYNCIDCLNGVMPNYIIYLMFLQKINLESSYVNCFICNNRAREVLYDNNDINIFCRKCLN